MKHVLLSGCRDIEVSYDAYMGGSYHGAMTYHALKAITDARGGLDERIFMRADKKADYGTVARVMGQLSGAGFKRLALVTEVEQGS